MDTLNRSAIVGQAQLTVSRLTARFVFAAVPGIFLVAALFTE
jgi:hypothetical protein